MKTLFASLFFYERRKTMCGYDPFYWYEKDLDDEYIEEMTAEEEEEYDASVVYKIGHFFRMANNSGGGKC